MADLILQIIQLARADHSRGSLVVLKRCAKLAQRYFLRPLHVGFQCYESSIIIELVGIIRHFNEFRQSLALQSGSCILDPLPAIPAEELSIESLILSRQAAVVRPARLQVARSSPLLLTDSQGVCAEFDWTGAVGVLGSSAWLRIQFLTACSADFPVHHQHFTFQSFASRVRARSGL